MHKNVHKGKYMKGFSYHHFRLPEIEMILLLLLLPLLSSPSASSSSPSPPLSPSLHKYLQFIILFMSGSFMESDSHLDAAFLVHCHEAVR